MKDRNVQFPNRFEIVAVPGTTNIFEVTPAPGEVYEEGTFWNKSNVLKDATAALYGKGSSASPDDIFANIPQFIADAISDRAKISTGQYTGTGPAGLYGTVNITTPFSVKLLIIIPQKNVKYDNYEYYTYGLATQFYGLENICIKSSTGKSELARLENIVATESSFSFSAVFLNLPNEIYDYIALG